MSSVSSCTARRHYLLHRGKGKGGSVPFAGPALSAVPRAGWDSRSSDISPERRASSRVATARNRLEGAPIELELDLGWVRSNSRSADELD